MAFADDGADARVADDRVAALLCLLSGTTSTVLGCMIGVKLWL
jgi:hypothetical protein